MSLTQKIIAWLPDAPPTFTASQLAELVPGAGLNLGGIRAALHALMRKGHVRKIPGPKKQIGTKVIRFSERLWERTEMHPPRKA